VVKANSSIVTGSLTALWSSNLGSSILELIISRFTDPAAGYKVSTIILAKHLRIPTQLILLVLSRGVAD
jgi:hypothetical protein